MKIIPLDDGRVPLGDKSVAISQTVCVLLGVGLAFWNIPVALIIGFVFLLPIIIASDLGESRDRSGWMWGLFLGWLGVLILAIMRPQPREVIVKTPPA